MIEEDVVEKNWKGQKSAEIETERTHHVNHLLQFVGFVAHVGHDNDAGFTAAQSGKGGSDCF